MLAIIAGFGTFIGLSAVMALAYGIACRASQFLNMLLRFSYLALPIKIAAWFAAAWVGMSVWEALG